MLTGFTGKVMMLSEGVQGIDNMFTILDGASLTPNK